MFALSLCVSVADHLSSHAPTHYHLRDNLERYGEVAREVLEASKLTATDPIKQFAVSFFDIKTTSLIPLKIVYFFQ